MLGSFHRFVASLSAQLLLAPGSVIRPRAALPGLDLTLHVERICPPQLLSSPRLFNAIELRDVSFIPYERIFYKDLLKTQTQGASSVSR